VGRPPHAAAAADEPAVDDAPRDPRRARRGGESRGLHGPGTWRAPSSPGRRVQGRDALGRGWRVHKKNTALAIRGPHAPPSGAEGTHQVVSASSGLDTSSSAPYARPPPPGPTCRGAGEVVREERAGEFPQRGGGEGAALGGRGSVGGDSPRPRRGGGQTTPRRARPAIRPLNSWGPPSTPAAANSARGSRQPEVQPSRGRLAGFRGPSPRAPRVATVRRALRGLVSAAHRRRRGRETLSGRPDRTVPRGPRTGRETPPRPPLETSGAPSGSINTQTPTRTRKNAEDTHVPGRRAALCRAGVGWGSWCEVVGGTPPPPHGPGAPADRLAGLQPHDRTPHGADSSGEQESPPARGRGGSDEGTRRRGHPAGRGSSPRAK